MNVDCKTSDKLNVISATLTGYWQNDIWDVTDPFFDDMRPKNWAPNAKIINFGLIAKELRNEVKFFFAKRLIEKSLSLGSAVTYGACFKHLAVFLSNSYECARSFTDIPTEKANQKWHVYLIEQGFQINKEGRLISKSYVTILQNLCTFYEDYFDFFADIKMNVIDLKSLTEPTNFVVKTELNPDKIYEIASTLTGYWQNDLWDTTDPVFEPFHSNKRERTTRDNKTINFSSFPSDLRNEVKFFIIKKLTERSINVQTALNYYAGNFSRLASFLSNSYGSVTSFANIPIEEALPKWRTYLIKRRLPCTEGRENTLRQLCTFFEYYYNSRDEYEKDIWNLRNIRDINVKISPRVFKLNFEVIPVQFRPLVKKFFKIFIKSKSSSSCYTVLRGLYIFFQYIHQTYPFWQNLQCLTRSELDSYFSWYHQRAAEYKSSRATYILALRTFLTIIQEENFPEAPTIPAVYLISKGDIPRLPSRSLRKKIKYAPQGVQQQLDANLEYLKPEHRSIILLLLATGWSIRDVLNLRYDRCLKRTQDGWSLYSESISNSILKKCVPISKDVAAIIQAEIEDVKSLSTSVDNPNKYLFIRTNGKRKGLPPTEATIKVVLNRLATKCNIVDEQGNLYHFSSQYLGTSKMTKS